jgi:hypothetical protein
MSKLPQDRRVYLVVRDLDVNAAGRILLATFETQQHPVELRTNFYLCTDVQQRPGGLPRLTLSNVTRDHRLPSDSAMVMVMGGGGPRCSFRTRPCPRLTSLANY